MGALRKQRRTGRLVAREAQTRVAAPGGRRSTTRMAGRTTSTPARTPPRGSCQPDMPRLRLQLRPLRTPAETQPPPWRLRPHERHACNAVARIPRRSQRRNADRPGFSWLEKKEGPALFCALSRGCQQTSTMEVRVTAARLRCAAALPRFAGLERRLTASRVLRSRPAAAPPCPAAARTRRLCRASAARCVLRRGFAPASRVCSSRHLTPKRFALHRKTRSPCLTASGGRA